MTAGVAVLDRMPAPKAASRVQIRPRRPQPPRMYFPAVDGLRGLAILSVLLYHTGWFSRGLFGVDVFMVLSGFLITLLMFREAGRTGRIAVLAFYRRRFKRLMPGLAVTLLLTIAFTAWLGGLDEARRTGGKAIAALLQVANWHQIAADEAYWEGFGRISPLAHMWSLSITEQFYLLWPLFFLVVFRLMRRSPVAVTVVLSLTLPATAWLAPYWYDGTNTDRLYLGTEVRAVDFVAGATAAGVVYVVHNATRRGRHARRSRVATAMITAIGLATLGALGTVSLLVSSYHDPWLYQGGIAAVAILSAVLIATLCHDRGPLVRLLSYGPLAEVGRISYTLYLLHLPIYWVMQQAVPTIKPYALFVVGGGLTWLSSMLMHYRLTERIRVRPWRPLRATTVAILLAGAIIAGGYALPRAVQYRLNPGDRPVVLVLGDSLAADLARALALDGNDKFAVVDGSISGCGVMDASAVRSASGTVFPVSDHCRIRQASWRESLSAAEFHAIMLHFGWDAAWQYVDGTWLSPCDSAYRDRYLAHLAATAELLAVEAPGVPVILVNEREGNATPEGLDCYNDLIADAADTHGWWLFDLKAALCPDSGCISTDDAGNPLFEDGVHLTAYGRRYLAPLLEARIGEVRSMSE